MDADLSADALHKLSQDDLVREAEHVLLEVYDEGAGEEALTRALMAERKREGDRARFWVDVYGGIAEQFRRMPSVHPYRHEAEASALAR